MPSDPVSFWARIDSNSANNPALNLTTDPAIEITFYAEDITGADGDLKLEQPADGSPDPDTVVEIGGVKYEFRYELTGTTPTTKANGAQQIPDQYEGSKVAVITVYDYPSPGDTTRIMFLPDETATEAEMNDFGSGGADISGLDTTPPPEPICFVTGTLIATPEGEVAVETLRAGDLILTASGAVRPVLWADCTTHDWPGGEERHKPILISAGALGGGLPRRDLAVSPQHRVLFQGPEVERLFGETEVLAPAKGLTGLPGIRWMKGKKQVTYHHILLESHDVLISEGLPTESFYPGPAAMQMMGKAQRDAVLELFPALPAGPAEGYSPPARRLLTRREAEQLAAELHRTRASRTAVA